MKKRLACRETDLVIKKEKSQKWANTSNSDSKLLEHGKIATTSYHFSPPCK